MNKYHWNFQLSEPLAPPYAHIMMLTSNKEVSDMVAGLDEVHLVSVEIRDGQDIAKRTILIHEFLDSDTAWLIIHEAIETFIKQRKDEQKWESAIPD